ncbi:MAG: hypothetical protein K8T91_00595 [Planctomycetes bacterium]|nr:hypothetical protein [Planctomycetota bacterium]
MAIKAGVWIDHKQATVVLLTDAGQEIKKVQSGIGAPEQPGAASKLKHKYTKNDYVAEDRLQRKDVSQRNKYYDDVLASLRGAEAILILGPGEAKGEFSKRIKTKKLPGRVVELETTDKMSDRQIAAKVSLHFAPAAAKKSVAPKKRPKTAIASPGKRTKMSNK